MSWRTELVQVLDRRAGLRLGDVPDGGVLARAIEERAGRRGCADAASYVRTLASLPHDDPELDFLVDLVANGQTYFFRHPEQLDAIVELATRLAGERRLELVAWRERNAPPALQVWCAGCSTGEEAYGLAIHFHEAGIPARILGTDLSVASLERARAATYSSWTLRQVSPRRLARYFVRVGERWSVCPSIRERVELRRHNLASAFAPTSLRGDGAWDLVLCRNVLIHLTADRVDAIATRLARSLAPDGRLYLSPAETLLDSSLPVHEGGAAGRSYGAPDAPVPRVPETLANDATTPAGDPVDALLRGELELAVSLLRDGIARDPSDSVAALDLGHALLRLHRLDEAALAYAHAERGGARPEEASFFSGLVQLKRMDDRLALASLRKAVFLDSTAWPAKLLLAGIYEREGRLDRARRELESVLATLERSARPWPMRSHPVGIPSATLDPDAAISLCRLRLANAERDAAAGIGE